MAETRKWVPALGIIALFFLFLLMPEIPNVFGIFKCKACSSSGPYLPLVGAGYFSILISLSLLFPNFPGPQTAKSGLTFAVLLAIGLTYIHLPNWCMACLISHFCHIAMWTIWVLAPSGKIENKSLNRGERYCLLLAVPISVVALFSALNLTVMIYNLKAQTNPSQISLKPGDKVPAFNMQTYQGLALSNASGATVLNFIIPGCPYCLEQLPILNSIATQLNTRTYRVINVTPSLDADLSKLSPSTEWIEDKEGILRKLFKVMGYPTIMVIGQDGKIIQTIPGVPEDLKSRLSSLPNQ